MNIQDISTKQELFDFVVGHLAAQGERSISELNDIGAYRGNGGMKCAIGCLIDDDFYEPHLESKSVGHVGFPCRILPKGVLDATGIDWTSKDKLYFHYSILGRLQTAHDRSTSRSDLIGNLVEIAATYGLSYEAVHLIERWDNAYLPKQ